MPAGTARGGERRAAVADLTWLLPFIAAVGVLLAGARLHGGPLALPAMSIALLVAGLLTATFLFFSARRNTADARVIAGALLLLGFAGALLSDGEAALLQLERMHASSMLSAAE